MKKLIFSWLLFALFLSATNAQPGTEQTGYEGDHFSLEGAIELFKQSSSIEDFEHKINTEDRWVNNLDLNRDNQIDYIRVDHRRNGNFHAIILQVPINRFDIQDVAVIEIEKVGRRNAVLQIVGDEDLYGEEVIVEPFMGKGYSSSRDGSDPSYTYDDQFLPEHVNVYYWPAVQDMFAPDYVVYSSPYSWRYYPHWWYSWRPFAWHLFHPHIVVYHSHYHVVHVHRVFAVHHFYKPYRSYSHHVVNHCNEVRVRHGKKAIHREKISQNHARIHHKDKRHEFVDNSKVTRNKKGKGIHENGKRANASHSPDRIVAHNNKQDNSRDYKKSNIGKNNSKRNISDRSISTKGNLS